VQGAFCGLAIGTAQALVLRRRGAFLWAPALSALWALGWAITTSIGVDVETQYTVFGASGALVVTAATALLPVLLATRAVPSAS
jgi:ABC-type lipoprotein release transport system permease subunit